MSSASTVISIRDGVEQSLSAFELLVLGWIETQDGPHESRLTCRNTIRDQQSRFKFWAKNVKADLPGNCSLDYRLRDSSQLAIQVTRLLQDLVSSLDEASSLSRWGTLLPDEDNNEDDEEGGTSDEEFVQLFSDERTDLYALLRQLTEDIRGTIGDLLRLSASLRDPAPHDYLMSSEYARVRSVEANTMAKLGAMFPLASRSVVVRMAQALSRKQQYFKYRASYSQTLPNDARTLPQTNIDIATTAPDTQDVNFPPLPHKASDGPFECPFCFMSVAVSGTKRWQNHVLDDLRPYACLADDCPVAARDYARQDEWIDHIQDTHWRTWTCPHQCGLIETSEASMRQHITSTHGRRTEMELDVALARCSRIWSMSAASPVNCPFCQETMESVRQYKRHVGRHQLNLSLSVLPNFNHLDDEDEGFSSG